MISIILPTYNRGSILDKTINCVLEQTYTHFELIIIDDNSNDNTKDVVNSYNDSRIKYFYNSINQGCALSREVGFKHSKGDILVFIDDDDKWKKDKLSKQITLIENQLSDMNFYHKEPETYKVCALQAEDLKHQLGSKEQKWLELELKREALGEIV